MNVLVRSTIGIVLVVLASSNLALAQMGAAGPDDPAVLTKRPATEKIAEALSAGPLEITKDARVVEMAAGMKTIELRAGTNS